MPNRGWFKKGNISFDRTGMKHTKETIEKIRMGNIGKKGISRYGEDNPFFGKKHSEKSRKKMSKSQLKRFQENPKTTEEIEKTASKLRGRKRQPFSKEWKKKIGLARIGKKLSEKTKRKISISNGGNGAALMKDKKYYHIHDWRYKQWKEGVFKRDNYICQNCGQQGGYLEPHHIKGWTKYPELRYELKNGATLCRECHKLTRKKSLLYA